MTYRRVRRKTVAPPTTGARANGGAASTPARASPPRGVGARAENGRRPCVPPLQPAANVTKKDFLRRKSTVLQRRAHNSSSRRSDGACPLSPSTRRALATTAASWCHCRMRMSARDMQALCDATRAHSLQHDTRRQRNNTQCQMPRGNNFRPGGFTPSRRHLYVPCGRIAGG